MGVPAFFAFLCRKYPNIMVDLPPRQEGESDEEYAARVGQQTIAAALCDNLYLDMNGIIHPCCHPEGKPAPKDEDEMFANCAELGRGERCVLQDYRYIMKARSCSQI